MKHPVAQTRNGKEVYVNLIGSRAAAQIAQQPQLLALAKEMLEKTTAKGDEVTIEHDMERLVGYSFIVATKETDTILYARLRKEDIYTRFVKNGKPLSTHYVTATLVRDSSDRYELSDVRIGRLTPPRPGNASETAESRPYWANHAFVLDSQPLQLQTVTKTCPY